MRRHTSNQVYHIELVPPGQDTETLDLDLEKFAEKFKRVMASGHRACITDNAMGRLSFQGHEMIQELGLRPEKDQVMIHLNTFHTITDLHGILGSCVALGIRQLLVVTGDGSDRLPKLVPRDLGVSGTEAVTSVELLRFIDQHYPGDFTLGVAFNPYEPADHEFAKLDRKLAAGAGFVITQPVIERHPLVDTLLSRYPDLQVIVEAWMSKRLDLLCDAVGYEISRGAAPYDPIASLRALHQNYKACGVYLSLLGFKTQFDKIKDGWSLGQQS